MSPGATAIEAHHWNTLFSAFDAKLTTVFDDKSPLLLGDMPDEICGKAFVFAPDESSRKYSRHIFGLVVYDHQVFVDALADFDDSELFMWDADKHIVCLKRAVDPSFAAAIALEPYSRFFDQSLQAHTRTIDGVPHYVLEPRGFIPDISVPQVSIPEKKWNYAQAEILLDGGTTSLEWDAAWTKYSFFRFHNLQNATATVTFPGFTLTIPRWATRCVRRKDGVYSAGYNYLQKMVSGDPRMLHFPNNRNTPWGSQGSNNVFSIKVLHDWILNITVSTLGWNNQGPRLMIDPEALHDISSLYSGTKFAAPIDESLIGDMLFHKGRLLSITTDGLGAITEKVVEFKGLATMAADFADAKIDVTDNGDGTFTLESADVDAVHHELWGITTNLLAMNAPLSGDGYDVKPGVDLKEGFTTTNHGQAMGDVGIYQLVAKTTSGTFEWSTLGAESGGTVPIAGVDDVTVVVEKSGIGEYFSPSGVPIDMAGWTVAEVESLEVYNIEGDGPLNNARGSYTANLRLSEGGILVTWQRKLSLNWLLTDLSGGGVPPLDSGFFQGIDATMGRTDQKVSVTFFDIEVTSGFTFGNWGWPQPGFPEFMDCRMGYRFYADTPADPLFFYDSDDDAKVEGPNLHHHPNIIHELENTDGQDWEIDPDINEDEEVRDVSILRPISLAQIEPDPFHEFSEEYIFGGYLCPDVLRELLDDRQAGYSTYAANRAAWLDNAQLVKFRVVRRNLVREDFNYIASLINACTKCRPFTIADFIPWSDSAGDFAGDFKEHLVGLYDGPFIPANMYASFPAGSYIYSAYVEYGVPVRTKADLPSDLATLKTTLKTQFNLKTAYDVFWEFLSTEPWGTGLVKHHYTQHWTVEDAIIDNYNDIPASSLFDPAIFEGTSGSDDYFWVTIADVQSMAESMGFKFHCERLTIPCKIRIFDVFADPIILHAHPESADYPYEEIVSSSEPHQGGRIDHNQWDALLSQNGNYAKMLQCLPNEPPTWLRVANPTGGYTQLIAISKDHAGDVITVLNVIPSNDFFVPFSILIVRLLIERDENRFLREDAGYIRHPENDTSSLGNVYKIPCLYHQSFVSAGINRLRKLVMHGIPSVKHSTTQFSVESYEQALGRLQHGIIVLPLEELPAAANQASTVITLTSQTQMITPPTAAQCFDILYFKDWPVSV